MKKSQKKLHWTQTPEGKIKLKTMKQNVKERRKNIGLGKMPEKVESTSNIAALADAYTPVKTFELSSIDSWWTLERFMQEFFAKGVRLAMKKNHDYTLSGDPFYNLKRAGITGFIVRLQDKFARIESLSTHGTLAITEEKFEDTLLDIANYAALMSAYLYNQRVETESGKTPR